MRLISQLIVLKKIFYTNGSITFIKNAGALTLSTLVAHVVSLFTTPIFSRIYTPADYGILSLFSAFSAFVATLVSLSFPVRIVVAKSEIEVKNLAILSVVLTIIIGLILLLILNLIPSDILYSFGKGKFTPFISFAVIVGMAISINNVFNYLMIRSASYNWLAIIKIVQSFISVSSLAVITFFFKIDNGLIYSSALSVILFGLLLYLKSNLRIKNCVLGDLVRVAKKHHVAPLHLFPTILMDVFTTQVIFFLIAFWFNESLVGQFRMAYSLINLPMYFIGASISDIFYQRFSAIWPDAVRAKKALFSIWTLLFIIGIIPFTTVLFFGENLFSFFLGSNWTFAGKIASLLALGTFVTLVHSPTSSSLAVMKEEKVLPLFGFAALIHRPLAIYIGYMSQSFTLGILLFSCFEFIHILVFNSLVLRRINRKISLIKTQ